jgi:hypothetical protein
MSQKTFHIELRCMNVKDNDQFEAVKKAAQRAARELHATAMLICGSDTPPQIMLYGEDFLNGKKELDSAKDPDDTSEG